jgi:hypothetical protein
MHLTEQSKESLSFFSCFEMVSPSWTLFVTYEAPGFTEVLYVNSQNSRMWNREEVPLQRDAVLFHVVVWFVLLLFVLVLNITETDYTKLAAAGTADSTLAVLEELFSECLAVTISDFLFGLLQRRCVFRNTLYKRRTQKMYETVVSVISQASL